jgi:P27 family predicted phage terminase small subunit
MRGAKPKPISNHGPAFNLNPPAELSPGAKKEWRRIVGLLSESRVLSNLDSAALAIYASSYDVYRQAEKHITANGSVCLGTTGTPMKNPYLTVQKECWERIRPLLAEFGLTPSARARLKFEPAEADDGEFF